MTNLGSLANVELSRWRIALAMALGHLAAAFAFAACLSLTATFASLGPLPRTLDGWFSAAQAAAWMPIITVLLGLFTAVLMLPTTCLTLPLIWYAAVALRTEAWATMTIGATVGMGVACLMLWRDGSLSPGPNHAPDMLWALSTFCSYGAVAGTAYGWTVWRLCIRPRLDRFGAARWRESV